MRFPLAILASLAATLAPWAFAQAQQPLVAPPGYAQPPAYAPAPNFAAPNFAAPLASPSAPAMVSPLPTPPLAAPPDGTIQLDYGDGQVFDAVVPGYQEAWTWQLLPAGLIYRSYLAGPQESHMSAVFNFQSGSQHNSFLDLTAGGHVGLIRYGTVGGPRPGGFQLDAEGSAPVRLDLREERDLRSADFRLGFPLTWAYGPYEAKFGYYHLSSHLGDEFILKHPGYPRLNYVRDELVLGLAYRIAPAIRLYGEAGYAFYRAGGAGPWQFQFGAEYSTLNPTGWRGSPFFAAHGNIRPEVNGGYVSLQTGWQWRGDGPGRLMRVGLNYFNGKSSQYSFFRDSETLTGVGFWYDY